MARPERDSEHWRTALRLAQMAWPIGRQTKAHGIRAEAVGRDSYLSARRLTLGHSTTRRTRTRILLLLAGQREPMGLPIHRRP